MSMERSDIIKEVSENLRKLSITFRYLEPVKQYRNGIHDESYLNDNSKFIIIKPIRIDKYQTLTYMQSGRYFKPISRLIMPDRILDEEVTEEII
jgi:hypothetical protein